MASGGVDKPGGFSIDSLGTFWLPSRLQWRWTERVYRHCSNRIAYAAANTSNMLTHLRQHHPNILTIGAKRKRKKTKTILSLLCIQAAPRNWFWPGQRISKSDRYVYSHGYAPVLGGWEQGFSAPHESAWDTTKFVLLHPFQRVVPTLYKQAKDKVVNELANIPCVVLTTDGWTSRATDSYLTVTPHHITRSGKWEVLCAQFERHTIACLCVFVRKHYSIRLSIYNVWAIFTYWFHTLIALFSVVVDQ